MTRKVVYCSHPCPPFGVGDACINDLIGLDPFCSYTIPDYLCDLEIHDGLRLVAIEGKRFSFAGGLTMELEEREEVIDLNNLDQETLAVVTASAGASSQG